MVSHIDDRGLAQGYFGTDPNHLVAVGMPFDLRLKGTDKRIGSILDSSLKYDSVLCIENDQHMRKNNYMKHTIKYCKNYPARQHVVTDALRHRAESLRLLVYRGYMEPETTYYFRFKTVLTDPAAYLFLDGFELCPKSVWSNPERTEDIW